MFPQELRNRIQTLLPPFVQNAGLFPQGRKRLVLRWLFRVQLARDVDDSRSQEQ